MQTPTLAILVEREEKIRAFRPRELLGSARHVSRARRANTPAAGSTRNGRRTTTIPTPAPSGCGTRRRRAAIVAKCTGKPGVVTEEAKPTTQGAPLLYDLTSLAARSQRPLRACRRARRSRSRRRSTKSTRCSPTRGPTRARCPRTTSAPSRRRWRSLKESNAYGAFAARGPEAEVGEAQQADLRQREGLRPLRDHPDARLAEAPERARSEALRFRRQALPRGVLSAGGVPRDHAHHARRGRAVQVRRQGAGRAGLARGLRQGSAGGRRPAKAGEKPTLAAVKPGEEVATEKVEASRTPRGRLRA